MVPQYGRTTIRTCIEQAPGQFTHAEFLDLSRNDPSLPCIAAMAAAIDPAGIGPIFVYNATYEKTRLQELAIRHPDHTDLLGRYIATSSTCSH